MKRLSNPNRTASLRLMLGGMTLILSFSLVLSGAVSRAEEAPVVKKAEKADTTKKAEAASEKLLKWHQSLAAGIEEARKRKVGILVKVGADWCGWCHKLDDEIQRPEVQQELANWVLVRLDADEDEEDVRKLSVGPIPALRIVDISGRPTRTHDGFLPADEFIAWLNDRAASAAEIPQLEILEGEFDPKTVSQIVLLLGHRDANIREAATRRLIPQKNVAGSHVIEAFTRGSLAVRLASIELLANWKAPIQDLDPWRPDTITAARLNDLETWVDQLDTTPPDDKPVEVPLAPEQIEAARREMLRLEQVDLIEAEAIGARLAHHGAALLPVVAKLRGLAETDTARERLDWLRYRLVASDTLALKWPGGLNKLAHTDPLIRRTAAAELASQITSGDEQLLLELFQNPDPIVRELALKALHDVGGTRAQEELTRLLNDPEPNVRTAVLKQMSIQPSSKLVPVIADYVTRETNADLVVHAVRLLRQIKSVNAVECLLTLLPHTSWQVRAEAVDAIGEMVAEQSRASNTTGITSEIRADAYLAILEVLSDSDSFVVSRVVNALKESDLAIAAPKLAAVVEKHPELGDSVADSLLNGAKIRSKGLPLLRAWLTSPQADLRAAAIKSLGRFSELDVERELIPALSDSNEVVRIAAAETLWTYYENQRPAGNVMLARVIKSPDPAPASGILGWLLSPFLPSATVTKPRAGIDYVEEVAPGADDGWLEKFRAGDGAPKWAAATQQPLVTMLQSQSAAERLAAALALIPIGNAAAPPVLLKLTQDGQQLAAVSRALRWMPWSQRAEFFGQLRSLATDPHQLASLCQELIVLQDHRASALLWEVLGGENVPAELAAALLESLAKNHSIPTDSFVYFYGEKVPPPVGVDVDLWTKFATTGTSWQKRVAWLLLSATDQDACRQLTLAAANDPQLSTELRTDAFQLLLLLSPKQEASKLAGAALLDATSPARRLALSFLAVEDTDNRAIAGGLLPLLPRNPKLSEADTTKVKIPEEITAEHLRSFLADPDPQIAAQSAYLLALLGHADGLEQLIAFYRKIGEHPDDDTLQDQRDQWEHRVYEAISTSDNSQYVPVLEQIYEVMARDRRDHVRNFYWSIRAMHGPEILKLRKRIREEIGMDELR